VPEYGVFNGRQAVLFGFRIRSASQGSEALVTAAVGIDDGTQVETDPPVGGSEPTILGWVGPEGEIVHTRTLPLEGRVGQLWQVAVAPEPNTVTSVSIRLVGPEA
jgi:hypothetical protein